MTQEPVMNIVNVQLGPSLQTYIIGIIMVVVVLIAVAFLIEKTFHFFRKSQ